MTAAGHDSGLRRQRGISLIVVLVALLILSFASLALLRSTDTATLITGNLSFKRTALASGDAATEAAITWLNANAATGALLDDAPANGYYATTADSCDLTGSRTPDVASDNVSWDGSDPGADCAMNALQVTPAGVASGYATAYIVNRMCNAAGDPNSLLAADGVTPMTCSRAQSGDTDSSTKSGAAYGNTPLSGTSQVYYRITSRVSGPRNTVRYVQTFVVL